MGDKKALTILVAALTVGCADILGTDVGNLNSGSLEDLETNPTPSAVTTAAQGLLIGARGGQLGYVQGLGIFGREGYNLDPGNPHYTTFTLTGPLTPSTINSNFIWAPQYRNLRQSAVVLRAVDEVVGISEPDKEALRGFVKTMQAYGLLMVINVTDEGGAAIDFGRPVDEELPPVVSKAEVFAHILQLLDEGRTHLLAAGAVMPLDLSSGFTGFTTPESFLRFNRALRARVNVYEGNWGQALTDLEQSFLDPAGSLSLGVYHTYSTNSGDEVNPLFDPTPRSLVAHQSTEEDAQLRSGGELDLRAAQKVETIPTRITTGIEVDLRFTVYNSPVDPIPIIRNEELILLRAEANLNLESHSEAADDINFIRVVSGGLEPIVDLEDQGYDAILDELLYNKRYSLLWEGGHRLIDLRRYGLLATLPKYASNHRVFPYFPLPVDECAARSPQPPGCGEVPGF